MKSYLSSVLKSVLAVLITVLITVLIPVLMLAGCEKAPEDTAGESSETQSSTEGFVFRDANSSAPLSAEEMTAIAQEYLAPLQFFESPFLYPDSLNHGYAFVKFGAWAGCGVGFSTEEVNDLYGVPAPEKDYSALGFVPAEGVESAAQKYFGLSPEECRDIAGSYYDEQNHCYNLPEHQSYDDHLIVPYATKVFDDRVEISFTYVKYDLRDGESALDFYKRRLEDRNVGDSYFVSIVFDEDGGWHYSSLVPTSTAATGTPEEVAAKAVLKELESSICSSRIYKFFTNKRVYPYPTNMNITSRSTYTCDIMFFSGGTKFSFPVEGSFESNGYYTELSPQLPFGTAQVGEDSVFLAGGNGVYEFNISDFTSEDFSEKVAAATGEGCKYAYFAPDYGNGYYLLCEKGGENFIFHLDENFDKISSVKCNACPIWSVWKYFAIEFDGREYACINDDYYDAITGEHYYLSRIACSDYSDDAEISAEIIKVYVKSGGSDRYIAAIRKNGKITDWFEFDGENMRTDFDFYEETNTKFDEETRILTATSSTYPGYSLTADFNAKTASYGFAGISDDDLRELVQTSADGRYSLYKGEIYGGGDAGYWALFLKNNQTGEIRYFRETGGMYGGFNFYGFLKNGDLYYMSSDSLKIYNPDTLEKTFDIGKNFDLEYREGEPWRLLFTFRRDPVNMDFIIVYSDISEDSLDWENSPSKKFTYRVGFLDKDGNLLESYDTGEFIRYGKFHVADVSLKLDGDILHMYYDYDNRGTYASGTFNIKTHEYKRD